MIFGTGQGGLGVLVPGNVVPVAGDGHWQQVLDGSPRRRRTSTCLPAFVLDGAGNIYIADSGSQPYSQSNCRHRHHLHHCRQRQPGLHRRRRARNQRHGRPPSAITLDGAGNLYIADTGNNVVRVIWAATGIITTIAGTGPRP